MSKKHKFDTIVAKMAKRGFSKKDARIVAERRKKIVNL